jgi:hypothetical protein
MVLLVARTDERTPARVQPGAALIGPVSGERLGRSANLAGGGSVPHRAANEGLFVRTSGPNPTGFVMGPRGLGGSLMRMTSFLILSAAALAGCGTSQPDREVGGAATGAGTGAMIGLLGGPIGVAAGALIGAGVGAGTGAVVSPGHVNLGPPPWSDR